MGNLPFIIEEEKIREYFSKCGEVESVRLLHDRITGKGRGIAYVAFVDVSSVFPALKLNESEFMERKIRISRIIKKSKVNNLYRLAFNFRMIYFIQLFKNFLF